MHGGFRQSMSWLHTWAGLVCGWVLCAIFLTGTLSVFREPITRWMQARPAVLSETGASVSSAGASSLEAAVNYLHTHAAGARFWRIELPQFSGDALVLLWPGQRGEMQVAMHPETGELLPQPWGRASEGGRHFMSFHYMLHWEHLGFWIVGAVSMCMLAALVSGVVMHRRIFADFFTFRSGKGQRSWLDAHNATAVFTLPFLFMIVYTGLFIFYTAYVPWPLQAVYGTDDLAHSRYEAELSNEEPPSRRARAGTGAALHDLSLLVQRAQPLMGQRPHRLFIENAGDAHATVHIFGPRHPDEPTTGPRVINNPPGMVVFDGVTGALRQVQRTEPHAKFTPHHIHEVMDSLHLVRFGGWPMRWLYFISGLLGTAMIATGTALFMVKRRRRSEAEFGAATARIYRAIEALNVASLAGICLASIAYLYGNRLLPADLSGRDTTEIRIFMLVWAASLLHALARPVGRAWTEQFTAAAVLCLALPLLNHLTVGQNLWMYALQGDGMRAGVELTVLAMGLVLAWLAWRVRVGQPSGKSAKPVVQTGYRWAVASRVLAACLGGYVVAAVVSVALALVLPHVSAASRADGVLIATLLSFAVYTVVALWVFCARSAVRAWAGLLGAALVLGAGCLLWAGGA